MQPRIELLPEKKLVGKRIRTSLSENKTADLWRSFMPYRNLIKNRCSTELFSVEIFDNSFEIETFTPDTKHEKWAAAEVSGFESLPEGMEKLVLDGGLYAVFIYRGIASNFAGTFHHIFNVWLPSSAYEPDQRPHFEIMGEKYSPTDPDSEEEIWIPVKLKTIL
jgi:AraC family transcriptional regulator